MMIPTMTTSVPAWERVFLKSLPRRTQDSITRNASTPQRRAYQLVAQIEKVPEPELHWARARDAEGAEYRF
jgi:hypothetical protein